MHAPQIRLPNHFIITIINAEKNYNHLNFIDRYFSFNRLSGLVFQMINDFPQNKTILYR